MLSKRFYMTNVTIRHVLNETAALINTSPGVTKIISGMQNCPVFRIQKTLTQFLKTLFKNCAQIKLVFYEPTDKRKAAKSLHSQHRIRFASPNLLELRAMAQFVNPDLNPVQKSDIQEILDLSKVLSHRIDCLIVTMGAKGVIIIRNIHEESENITKTEARLYPVSALEGVVSVSGAGDCFASGFIHGILLQLNEPSCVSIAIETAKSALLSSSTVPTEFNINTISKESFYESLH